MTMYGDHYFFDYLGFIIYILLRLLARQLAGKVSTQWMQLPSTYQTWIGTALMPKAGIAIGMLILLCILLIIDAIV
ncbi:hypothetical protein [Aliikangiella sp. IMCC44359]|uniref:hypothetical protein n=1 Tax=Aliikangiella sp. IMCC44359 TaxID=3459125 RepID=UPI00403A8FF4